MMNEKIKINLDKWIAKNYNWLKKEISKNITKQQMSQYTDDLLHHVISDLYKLNDSQLENLLSNNKVGHWCLRAASLQIRSKTSPFYYQFRKHKLSVRSGIIDASSGNTYDLETYKLDIEPPEELIECFERAQEQLHWYLKTIFNQKFKEGKTLQEIYEYYNITKRHLVKDLNSAINEIREVCKDAE